MPHTHAKELVNAAVSRNGGSISFPELHYQTGLPVNDLLDAIAALEADGEIMPSHWTTARRFQNTLANTANKPVKARALVGRSNLRPAPPVGVPERRSRT